MLREYGFMVPISQADFRLVKKLQKLDCTDNGASALVDHLLLVTLALGKITPLNGILCTEDKLSVLTHPSLEISVEHDLSLRTYNVNFIATHDDQNADGDFVLDEGVRPEVVT